MFFVFLCSVSLMTLVITVSCVRVLSECYGEGVREEESERMMHHHDQEQSGMEYHDDDEEDSWSLHRFHYHIFLRILSKQPIELAFGLFSLLCAWSITSLTCFHALIITLGQTTNERVRGVYQYGGVTNPADRGCWKNWMEMMWRKVPESRLPSDFSDLVDLNAVTTTEDNGSSGSSRGCGGECSEEVTTRPIVLEESVWPGWQESRMIPPHQPTKAKNPQQPKAKSKK